MRRKLRVSCIASSFYIKPQLRRPQLRYRPRCIASSFYIKPQPICPHEQFCYSCIASSFYIKPQLHCHRQYQSYGCIASSFYIKPQLPVWATSFFKVVLHPLSTSNHNKSDVSQAGTGVVLHPLSTSNHNTSLHGDGFLSLYCILFLHQTTTKAVRYVHHHSCIASSFYIKPQLNQIHV